MAPKRGPAQGTTPGHGPAQGTTPGFRENLLPDEERILGPKYVYRMAVWLDEIEIFPQWKAFSAYYYL